MLRIDLPRVSISSSKARLYSIPERACLPLTRPYRIVEIDTRSHLTLAAARLIRHAASPSI